MKILAHGSFAMFYFSVVDLPQKILPVRKEEGFTCSAACSMGSRDESREANCESAQVYERTFQEDSFFCLRTL